MSMIVFQGLQSSLDAQIAEQTTVRLRIAPAQPPISQLLELGVKSSNFEQFNENWYSQSSSNLNSAHESFSQALSNCPSSYPKEASMNRDRLYIHPLSKTSHCLSARSLELCTENLGSETGCDTAEEDCLLTCFPPFPKSELDGVDGDSSTGERVEQHRVPGARKQSNARSFPPPLTTISGSESIRIRPHREGGRVVMKAVTHPYLQAERSHGRLRLCFLHNYSAPNFDDDDDSQHTTADAASKGEKDDYGASASYGHEGDNEAEEEQEEEEEEGGCDEEACLTEEDMDGINLEFGVKTGREEFQKPSRCKRECDRNSNGYLLNWESHWVATS